MKQIEKRKYLTYNEVLNAEMHILGFKREGGDWFVKHFKDTEQKIGFSHASYSEKNVRYYAIHIHLVYPKIKEIIDALGVLVFAGFGMEIGYLMPENRYYEWRIAESDSNSYVEEVVEDMISKIRRYVIPFIDKYSSLHQILKGIENSELRFISNEKYLIPILHYIEGDRDYAIQYVRQSFEKMEMFIPNHDINIVQDEYKEKTVSFRENKEYGVYKTFLEKFEILANRKTEEDQLVL